MERLVDLRYFLDNKHGAQWYKVNLHVHGKGQSPDEIVNKAIEAGISLIAITDHNTFQFVKPIQDAAKKIDKANLVVLPGIEITLEEGAHIIAIFDEDFNETKQTHFLGTLKIPLNGSDRTPVKDKTCSAVLTDITDDKGITVVPHPFSENIGFLDSARKISTKMTWLESGNIGLIQIPEDKVQFIGHHNGVWQNRYILSSTPATKISSTDYSLSPINEGESKDAVDINNGSTWLKLGSRTVRGLRQVTCEPRTCISRNQPFKNIKYKLLGLTVKGGFFDGLKISFSSELTCIFGENHSGKTAIFDFISFALGRDRSVLSINRDEELELLLRRLSAILQPEGEVNLYFIKNGKTYCIYRKFIPEYGVDETIIKIRSVPEIFEYNENGDELIPIDEPENAIFLPEIYSQGHVGILRKSVQSQLSLIDELSGLSEQRKKREELRQNLKQNADSLADLYDEKEKLIGSVGNLKDLKKELKQDKEHLKETDNELWDNTKNIIEDVKSSIEGFKEKIATEKGLINDLSIPSMIFQNDKTAQPEILKSVSEAVERYNKSISSAAREISLASLALQKSLLPLLQKWDAEYDVHKKEVTKTLRGKGFESPEQLLRKVETLQIQINTIEKRDLPKLQNIEEQIKDLNQARCLLLREFRDVCTTINNSRKSKIDELNKLIGPDIRIRLDEPSFESFLDLMKGIYSDIASQDRKLQKRDEQFTLLVKNVTSIQLLEAISNNGQFRKKDGQMSTLCESCGITENTQQVLCTIIGVVKSLHKLQVFDLEPIPKISVKREGTNVFADLTTELSPGEQSSAILTLALMVRDEPLIIDQPEDELGYSYIVNKIVPKILDSKAARQIILISHNANIPVLADAELLMKIRNNPTESKSKCSIDSSGTFADEHVCAKVLELEGGERAFQVRQYRYAIPRKIGIN